MLIVSQSRSSAGAVVAIKDYANTFDSNAVTLNRNGSPIGGDAQNKQLTTEGIAVTLIYIDSTKGWLVTDDGLQSNVKAPTYTAEYLVVAGAGAGGSDHGGGGGAGGLLTNFGGTAITLTGGQTYTATVGSGGTGHSGPGAQAVGADGNNSVLSGSGISTVTSTAGGGGGAYISGTGNAGRAGGSGGRRS